MSQQRYGVPALLSLAIPGLGQLVKGQWERAVIFGAAILVPWVVLGVHAIATAPEASGYISPLHFVAFNQNALIGAMLRSPYLPIVSLIAAVPWLWSVVDAYRHPEHQ